MGLRALTMTNHYASLTIEQLQKSHEGHLLLRVNNGGAAETFGTGYWNE
jgi:hypothetical protein